MHGSPGWTASGMLVCGRVVTFSIQDVGDPLRYSGHCAAEADEEVVGIRVRRRAHDATASHPRAGAETSEPIVTASRQDHAQ